MRRGFTLIELVVVLALLGMMAAVSVPAFRNPDRQSHVAAVATSIQSVIATAHDASRQKGTNIMLTMEPSTGRYWMHDAAQELITTSRVALPFGVSIAGTAARRVMRFSPTGGATADTLVVMSDPDTRLVFIDPWTGESRVERR